jgi:hypothetical protein
MILLDLLLTNSSEWEKFSGYKKFFEFVKKLAVLNDAGERGVKGIHEVVGKTQGPAISSLIDRFEAIDSE